MMRALRNLDPFWALALVVLAAALLAVILGAPPAHALTSRDPAVVDGLALVTPTPWADGASVLEITEAGNVALPGRPVVVMIVGETPLSVLPARCREDLALASYPRGTLFVCMPDDALYRRAHPDFDVP